MRTLLFSFLFLPLYVVGQEVPGQEKPRRDLVNYQLHQTKGNVRYLHVINYSDVSTRLYDSVAAMRYPSGNLQQRTYYSRYAKDIPTAIWHYRDNALGQADTVYRFDAYVKKYLVNLLTYNQYGVERITSFEQDGRVSRVTTHTYNEKGQLAEKKQMEGARTEYLYRYEYDHLGRVQKEIHAGTGEDIYYTYDHKGNKMQEIYRFNDGKEIRKIAQYNYDVAGNMAQLQIILGESNLVKDVYRYNSAGQRTERIGTGQSGYADNKQIFTYDEGGYLKDEMSMRPGYEAEFWFDTDGLKTKSMERQGMMIANRSYQYNASKKLVKVTTEGTQIVDTYTNPSVYEYDSLGNLIGLVSPQTKTTVTYNKKCNATSTTMMYNRDMSFLNEKTEFTYDTNCLLKQKIVYRYYMHPDYGPARPPDTTSTSWYYDGQKRLVEEVSGRTGMEIYHLKLKYNGSLLAEASYTEFNHQAMRQYIFNDKEEIVQMKSIDSFPETNRYSYTYDERGNWIRRVNDKEKGAQRLTEVVERVILY